MGGLPSFDQVPAQFQPGAPVGGRSAVFSPASPNFPSSQLDPGGIVKRRPGLDDLKSRIADLLYFGKAAVAKVWMDGVLGCLGWVRMAVFLSPPFHFNICWLFCDVLPKIRLQNSPQRKWNPDVHISIKYIIFPFPLDPRMAHQGGLSD